MTDDGDLSSGSHMHLRPGSRGSIGEKYLTAPGRASDMFLGLLAPVQPLGSGAATGEGQRRS